MKDDEEEEGKNKPKRRNQARELGVALSCCVRGACALCLLLFECALCVFLPVVCVSVLYYTVLCCAALDRRDQLPWQ